MTTTYPRTSNSTNHFALLLDHAADPLGYEAGDANLRRYVGNSPALLTDPEGLKSKAEWQAIANSNAGIDLSRWKPENGYDYDVNADIVRRLYNHYSRLYHNDPDKFLWAGNAYLVGLQIIGELNNIKVHKARCDDKASDNWNLLHAAITRDIMKAVLVRYESLTMRMAMAVFQDMAWQHEAFASGGIAEMEKLFKAGELSQLEIDGWRKIHRGDVAAGNVDLLNREQKFTLQPFFDQFREDDDNLMSNTAKSLVPGVKPFCESVPGGNVTDFEDRWKWAQEIASVWASLARKERDKLVPGHLHGVKPLPLPPFIKPVEPYIPRRRR